MVVLDEFVADDGANIEGQVLVRNHEIRQLLRALKILFWEALDATVEREAAVVVGMLLLHGRKDGLEIKDGIRDCVHDALDDVRDDGDRERDDKHVYGRDGEQKGYGRVGFLFLLDSVDGVLVGERR